MIVVTIDELTPCLQNTLTGELIETEVVQIRRKSFLQKFNRKNGWYTSWANLSEDNEIFALVIKGTIDIQGLLAIRNNSEMRTAFVTWMVSAPHNNPQLANYKKYTGVGGHLFAIAASKSEEYGYHCEMTGFAANRELLAHYINELHAIHIGYLHPYHFVITSEIGKRIKETYTYEWTYDQL